MYRRDLTVYEALASDEDAEDLYICNRNFDSSKFKGLYYDGCIAISNDIDTEKERACVLAEELGHHYTTFGDILEQKISVDNRKQELKARLWGYNKLIGLAGILSSYQAGYRNAYEMAEYLNVTEEYLKEAIEAYRRKYGICTRIDNCIIYFEPNLTVLEIL